MTAFRMQLAAVASVGLVLGVLLTWTSGLWPGDQARATVDHCYITYDRLEVMHSRCSGNWSRGDRGYRGPIHGVDVTESWKVVDEEPNSAYEWEVVVPESAKRPWVIADGRQAWMLSPQSLPWVLLPAAFVALLVVLAWSITATVKARKPTPSDPAESAGTPA